MYLSTFYICVSVLFIAYLQHEQNRLSVCNKICYAIGGAPYQITGCALGFFLQIYLLDVAQVRRLKLFPNSKEINEATWLHHQ